MKNRKCLLILLLVLFMPLMVDVLDEYVGRGFDFDRISKVNDLYFFFSGPKMFGVYNMNGKEVTYRWNRDTNDYGYYDENDQWISISVTEYGKKLNDASDVGYIYDYFYNREFNKYIEKYKSELEQMGISYTYTDLLYGDDIELPTQAMISSSYKDKYYIGYLDSENSTYMALIHNRTTDIKINGKLFFSVILGDDYFILLDSDISTCNQTECKKTHMKKYNYDGNVISFIVLWMFSTNTFLNSLKSYNDSISLFPYVTSKLGSFSPLEIATTSSRDIPFIVIVNFSLQLLMNSLILSISFEFLNFSESILSIISSILILFTVIIVSYKIKDENYFPLNKSTKSGH